MKNKQAYLKVDTSLSFCTSNFLLDDNTFIRVFNNEISDDEFEWHRDSNERVVIVLYADPSKTWKFQFDNELPFIIKNNDVIEIQKEKFHKLHKGEGVLVIYVKEK